MTPRGRRSIATGLVAGAAACAPAPTLDVGRIPPDVDLIVHTRYYPVSSATISALRAQRDDVGVLAPDQGGGGARNTRLRWTFGYLRRGMICGIRDVRVVVTGEVRLPRWEPDPAPDSATLAWWRDFTARRLEHERGRVRIAVEGAREIVETLRPMEGSISCEGLGMRANGAAQFVVVRTRERQAEYDRLARLGTAQAPDTTDRLR